jgi:hypothetical protein
MMDDSNFFSIDRLVEFGMGMAMARQMVNVMNQSMQSMYVPGSIQSMPKPILQQHVYYVAVDGQPVGPLNDSELSQLITQKKVNKNTLAWVPGMSGWEPVEQVPAILKVIALTPPQLQV